MKNVVGIDLGTTFSAIAMINSIGKPEIIPNAEGERITASALYFDNDADNTVYVGQLALNQCDKDASRFARWIKRYMGDKEYPATIAGRRWTPSELSSFILKKLAKDAAVQKGPITDAVISVPAYFDETRRGATMEAGKMAGLNVIGIINEPTAAAIYYATEYQLDGKTLVFDLGGGTFDVTILTVGKDARGGTKVDIICSRGDHQLGGYDFDKAITAKVDADYRARYGKILTEVPERRNRCELDAEDMKRTLSKIKELNRPFMGAQGPVDFRLTQSEFEASIAPYIARIEMLVEDVLDEAKLSPSDIRQVILAGGSTRIPAVERLLTRMFKYPPTKVGNVDECVALGAALYAGLITLSEQPASLSQAAASTLSNITLKEVCNHSYGTFALTMNDETGKPEKLNDIIIQKNSKIPVSVTKTYYTVVENQEEIDISVTQGEGLEVDMVNIICEKNMPLTGRHPAQSPVEVTYFYDKNQRMHCTFLDVKTGNKIEMELDILQDQSQPGPGHPRNNIDFEDLFNID